jgi:Tfp pilus assembly protein PilX
MNKPLIDKIRSCPSLGHIRGQRGGTIILLVMFMLMAIVTSSLAAAEIVRLGLIMSRSQVHSNKAYFAAEAGAERILWEMRKNDFLAAATCTNGEKICFNADETINDCLASCDAPLTATTTLSNGANSIINYNYITDGIKSTTTLTCWGNFSDVRRKVELKY